jgi:hypothetical protein
MLKPAASTTGIPHHCGVNNPADATRCWLCGEPLGTLVPAVVVVEPKAPARLNFALSSLLLFMLGCSVCMAIVRWHFGVGIMLGAVLIPATLKMAWELKRRDYRLSVLEKAEVLLASTFATLVLGIAVTTAFFIVWVVTTYYVSEAAGWAAGIAVGSLVAWSGLRIWLR